MVVVPGVDKAVCIIAFIYCCYGVEVRIPGLCRTSVSRYKLARLGVCSGDSGFWLGLYRTGQASVLTQNLNPQQTAPKKQGPKPYCAGGEAGTNTPAKDFDWYLDPRSMWNNSLSWVLGHCFAYFGGFGQPQTGSATLLLDRPTSAS